MHGPSNRRAGKMRCEQFDEVVSITAQVFVLAYRDPCGTGLEQVTGIHHAQVFVALRDEGHFCEYSYTQSQFNVSLDHVRIDRGQRDVRADVGRLESGVDLAASAEGEVVRDDRVLSDLRQRQFFLFQQGMMKRRDDAMVPFVAGQRDEFVIQRQAFGRDPDIGIAVQHLFGDLRRVALMQTQPHAGIALDESFDGGWQGIARLSVRGGNGQMAAVLRLEFFGDLFEISRIMQHALGDCEDSFAWFGDGHDALAVAHEDLDAQFLFQQLDLFADAGLRRVQRPGSIGDLQTLPHDFVKET